MTLIMAHRGSSGNYPENTLPAFAGAVREGADGIELDVHLSKDGHLIVIHDESVDRTTNGSGLIRELTLEQIKAFDAGSWFGTKYTATKIPTLNEVLALLLQMGYRGFLNIELKTDKYHYPEIESTVSELMTGYEWPFSHWYCSFNFESLRIMSEVEPGAQLDMLFKNSKQKLQMALDSDFIEGIHPSFVWVAANSEMIADFPKSIRPWTINSYEMLLTCFKLGVTGVITDFPSKAARIRSILS